MEPPPRRGDGGGWVGSLDDPPHLPGAAGKFLEDRNVNGGKKDPPAGGGGWGPEGPPPQGGSQKVWVVGQAGPPGGLKKKPVWS